MNTNETIERQLIMLASAIRGERKAINDGIRADFRAAIDSRLEGLALLLIHDVEPSTYIDTRAAQVDAANLAPIFRAGGTF